MVIGASMVFYVSSNTITLKLPKHSLKLILDVRRINSMVNVGFSYWILCLWRCYKWYINKEAASAIKWMKQIESLLELASLRTFIMKTYVDEWYLEQKVWFNAIFFAAFYGCLFFIHSNRTIQHFYSIMTYIEWTGWENC